MKMKEERLRGIIREEVDQVLSKAEHGFDVGDDLNKTLYIVTKPSKYDPDNVIDRQIDPGSARKGRGVDLDVIEQKYVEETNLPSLLRRAYRDGRDFLSDLQGIFTEKEEALNYAVDYSDKLYYGD